MTINTTTRPVASATGPASRPNALKMICNYARHELIRQLRQFETLFFIVVLPLVMFLIFGAMQEFSVTELPNGRGNIGGLVMISFAAYGAVTATSSLAGTAALEIQQGWGRQIGITPFRRSYFIMAKAIVSVALALLPIFVIFIAGMLTSARLELWVWFACGALLLVPAVVFSLYGLAMGTLFRSEAAVSAAAGLVVVLMFGSGFFMPLSGFLFDMAPFTPLWGVMLLAVWPLQEGFVVQGTEGDFFEYELWQAILSVVIWAIVFAVLAWVGARRGTSRR